MSTGNNRRSISQGTAMSLLAPRVGKRFTFTNTQKYVDCSLAIGSYVDVYLVTADADGVALMCLDETSVSGDNAIDRTASTTSGDTLADKEGIVDLRNDNPLFSFCPSDETKYLHGLRIGSNDITVSIVVR